MRAQGLSPQSLSLPQGPLSAPSGKRQGQATDKTRRRHWTWQTEQPPSQPQPTNRETAAHNSMSNGEAQIRALLSIGLGSSVGLYDALDWQNAEDELKHGAPRLQFEVGETLRHGLRLQCFFARSRQGWLRRSLFNIRTNGLVLAVAAPRREGLRNVIQKFGRTRAITSSSGGGAT
jgi:predicted component of type VI protein secretion system